MFPGRIVFRSQAASRQRQSIRRTRAFMNRVGSVPIVSRICSSSSTSRRRRAGDFCALPINKIGEPEKPKSSAKANGARKGFVTLFADNPHVRDAAVAVHDLTSGEEFGPCGFGTHDARLQMRTRSRIARNGGRVESEDRGQTAG